MRCGTPAGVKNTATISMFVASFIHHDVRGGSLDQGGTGWDLRSNALAFLDAVGRDRPGADDHNRRSGVPVPAGMSTSRPPPAGGHDVRRPVTVEFKLETVVDRLVLEVPEDVRGSVSSAPAHRQRGQRWPGDQRGRVAGRLGSAFAIAA